MTTHSTASMQHDEPGVPDKNTLVARAGVARTFGGLGGFLAIMFLGAGVYLLQEALSDPLRAQAVGLIAGAFILALATILLYFIFSPRPGYRRRNRRRRSKLPMPKHTIASARASVVPQALTTLPAPSPAEKQPGDGLPLPA